MTQKKEITIKGKNYPIIFTLKTMINFEEITGKSFFAEKFEQLKERIALVMAAVIAADKDTDLTIEMLMDADNMKTVTEIITAYNVVMSVAGEFFAVPDIEPKPEKPEEEEEGDKVKN